METLQDGGASVTIDHEHGGRLSSLVVAGHELLVARETDVDPAMGWGCFPMAPWAGRIRHGRFTAQGREVELPRRLPPHAIHGTVLDRPWTATGAGRLRTELGPDWPWVGRVEQEVELEADDDAGRLDLTLRIVADDAMPVTAGWHPWFHRRIAATDLVLTLPAERMWIRDREGIPSGRLVEPPPGPWDDCFTALVGPVELQWPDVLTLWVDSDCEHVVVYDEQDHAVCVEPQSAPPDAHNSGEDLVELGAEDAWEVHATLAWQVA